MKYPVFIKACFLFLYLKLALFTTFAQTNLYINDKIVVGETDTLFITGSLLADTAAYFDNRKELYITDSLNNLGTKDPLFEPSSYGKISNEPGSQGELDKKGKGKTIFTGNDKQIIESQGKTLFYNVDISNDSNVVLLDSINALFEIIFNKGNLNLQGQKLKLYYQKDGYPEYRSGFLGDETDFSKVIDSIIYGNTLDTLRVGCIEAKRQISTNDREFNKFNNIGLINYSSPGLSTFRRYHFSDTMVTGGSIKKLYHLVISGNKGINEDLTIKYLNSDTVAGHVEDSLIVWQYGKTERFYKTNNPGLAKIYFPTEQTEENNTTENLVQGKVIVEDNYIYTAAPINCNNMPEAMLPDSMNVCIGALTELAPFGDSAIWSDHFYRWSAPHYVEPYLPLQETKDTTIYAYSFIPGDSIKGYTFPIIVEIRDVKGCSTTDTTIITVRDNSAPMLKMFDAQLAPIAFGVCSGQTIYIQDTLRADTTTPGYTWWFGTDTLYNQTSKVARTLSTPGEISFGVQYKNEYGCIARKPDERFLVYPYPEVNIAVNQALCQGTMPVLNNNTSIPIFNFPTSIRSYSWKIGEIDSIYVNNSTTVSAVGSVYNTETVSIENQSPDLSFLFNNSGSINIALTATSNQGCVTTDSTRLYINPAVQAQFDTSALNNVCLGSPSIFFPGNSCTRGNDINYKWTFVESRPSELSDTAYFTFSNSRNYQVELIVSSDSGCSDTTVQQVIIHPNSIAGFTAENHCLDTGKITYFQNQSEGSADRFTWNYGNGISNANGSVIYDTAGLYTVKLIANNQWNCLDSIEHNIEIYALPQVSFTAENGVCINEQYNIIQNTTQGAESYYWNFGDGSFSEEENPVKRYTEQGPWTISLQATSEHGCENTYSRNINVYPQVEAGFNNTGASVCEGQNSLFVPTTNLTGLSEINWVFGDGNSQIAPANNPGISYVYAQPGSYKASIITISENACTDTSTAIVRIAPIPDIEITTGGEHCINSEVVFGLNNNTPVSEIAGYQWNFDDMYNPANNTSNAASANHYYTNPGSYNASIEVLSNNGCRATDTQLVTINLLPEIQFGDTSGTCGITLELIAGPAGLDYLWSTGEISNTITATTSSNYSVTVTNQVTGCSNWKETHVKLSAEVTPGLPANIEACDNAILDAHNPGGIYSWSTGETTRTINIETSGTYWVEVTDMNNCTGNDTVIATINASPEISLPEVSYACEGSNLTLDPGNITGTYVWNTGSTSQTIQVNTPGYYWVSATSNMCSANAISNVVFSPKPIVFLGGDRFVCEDQLPTISAGNPMCSYLWSNGETTQAITPATTGLYNVEVTNSYGCTGTDTLSVQVNALPNVDLGENQSLCEEEALILDAGIEADNYYWSNNAFTREITITEAGTYWVRVTDRNNCTSISETIDVTYKSLPQKPFTTYHVEACNYELLDAKNAGAGYVWNDGNTGRNYLAESSGLYTVNITNNLGCSLRDSVNLTIKPMAEVSLGNEMEICTNGSGIIDAGNFGSDYTYQWNTGSTEQFVRVSSGGMYKLSVTHVEGCVGTDSINVSTKQAPKVDLGSDAFLCKNSGLTLNAGNPGSTYFWGNTAGLSFSEQEIPVLDTGKYWVYVIAENGCSGSDSVEILYTNQSIEPLFMCASKIRIGDTVRFVDLSVPEPGEYFWDFGDMVSSTENEPTHVYYTEEVFNARLTVTNQVCKATIQKPLTVKGYNPEYLIKLAKENQKPIAGLIQINRAKIYPVPAREYITLSMEISEQSDIAYYLYNINGQILEMQKFNAIEQVEHTINISGFREGMYFLRVVTRNESKTFKIIKN